MEYLFLECWNATPKSLSPLERNTDLHDPAWRKRDQKRIAAQKQVMADLLIRVDRCWLVP